MPTTTGGVESPDFGFAQRWLVVATSLSSSLALALSGTITNVAVPDIMGAFGVGQDQAQWMATGFLATMSVSMLVSSWLIEVLGQRITFIAILTIFGIGSFMSAVAPNIDILIVGRVLQGAANGVGQPLAMFTMFSVFPPDLFNGGEGGVGTWEKVRFWPFCRRWGGIGFFVGVG